LLVEERGGLSAEVHPDALSHGEQQLLAITRAVLRKRVAKGRSILILDEATSNIDAATQEVVQKVIETEFKDNTVITVAHRLETIKDSDMVIILNNGRISKMGPPSEVL
jgi:ABC-type multidrug transport system fused ATPase/permease subunit